MKWSGLWSILMIFIILISLILFLFFIPSLEAQYLFPAATNPYPIYGYQGFSALSAYSIGFPVQAPVNLQGINPGFYPNAVYLGTHAASINPAGQYTSNAGGYYLIESSSDCTCNLP